MNQNWLDLEWARGGEEVRKWPDGGQRARLTLLIWHRELLSPDIRRPLPLNLTVMGALSPVPNRWRHSRFRVVTAAQMSRVLGDVTCGSHLVYLIWISCLSPDGGKGVFTFSDKFYKLLSTPLLVIRMFYCCLALVSVVDKTSTHHVLCNLG